MKTQIPNINMVRSAWRRVKKNIKDAIIRDLRPEKDVKGGGGVTGRIQAHHRQGHHGHTRPLIRIKSHHRSVRGIAIQLDTSDLTSDALPFGRLWYGEPNAVSNAVDYAKFRSRSCVL